MSNRTHQKFEKYGYKVLINRSGKIGEAHWERVGFLFGNSLDAREYLDRKYPDVKKWSVEAVRLNVEPIVSYGDSSDEARGRR